ncbi:MAG: hypothetical protein ACRDRS_15390 [Pseudonocardiaceae bacterium]
MASESSPICFRVPADERSLLEVVARHQGQTLSAFVRSAVINVAQGLVDEYGVEAVFKKFETIEARRAEELSARVDEFRARLLPQQPHLHPQRHLGSPD